MRSGTIALLLLIPILPGLRAEEPLNPPVPLAPPSAALSPGGDTLSLEAAQRAQELGLPEVAVGLYRELLASTEAAPAAGRREQVVLALITVLIDTGRTNEAEQELTAFPGQHGAAWHLRRAMVATQLSRPDDIRGELDAINPDELSRADRPWYLFLRGMVAEGIFHDRIQAESFYRQAEAAAPTELARTQFLLRDEENRLQLGKIDPQKDVEDARERMEQYQGTSVGYDQARYYAVILNAVGRKMEAMSVLQRQLLHLPPAERARADDFRLLLGLIGGAADGLGRNALMQLLETGDAAHQGMALELLARASQSGAARESFRRELDKLAAAVPARPVIENILFFRAEFALGDKDYPQAEEGAHELIEKFPASPLQPYALGILTGSAWEQRRYRAAAAAAQRAHDAAPPGDVRSSYAVLVAEAWFRAGDFPSAADAYAAAMRERPSVASPGELMFQLVQAEIAPVPAAVAAGQPEVAARALAAAEETLNQFPGDDFASRWEAEWNFARMLQIAGKSDEAYDRVGDLLLASRKGNEALPAELKVRMAWLQAKLSFDVRRYDQTLALTVALGNSLEGVNADLKNEIASSSALLKAQAYFALSLDGEAHDVLEELRVEFPSTDAAVYSYIIEADHYAQQDRVVDGLRLLTELAERFPSSSYAPYALYRAALLAERLGQRKNFEDANRYIESLVTKYPASDLVFDARLKQGDLMREMNNYSQAEQDYDLLLNSFPQHEGVVLAQLAKAECYNAQWATDPSHAERAADLFEHLLYRVDAPADVRVEAGFNLGDLDRRRNRLQDAERVWWDGVVHTFLLEDPNRAAQLSGKGRYWMTRTLIELGDLLKQRGQLDDARQAWRLVLKYNLPFASVAQSRLNP
jgi:cellulose synthase operon protein C